MGWECPALRGGNASPYSRGAIRCVSQQGQLGSRCDWQLICDVYRSKVNWGQGAIGNWQCDVDHGNDNWGQGAIGSLQWSMNTEWECSALRG
jgi:hypothetical protein